jgi:hypothetical protein
VNGIQATDSDTPSAWRGDDLLVFETKSKITYILRNYNSTKKRNLCEPKSCNLQSSLLGKEMVTDSGFM